MKYHDYHINGILICVDRGPVHRHVNSYFQPAEYASLVWQSRFPNACMCIIMLGSLRNCHCLEYSESVMCLDTLCLGVLCVSLCL